MLDLRGISSFTDFFVICSGTSVQLALAGALAVPRDRRHGARARRRPLLAPAARAASGLRRGADRPALDLSHAVVHYTVTGASGLDVSYEVWATAAGSVSVAHEGARVVERGTTLTSASIWSPERNEVVTASRPSEAGGGDGLSLDEVSVAVRDGRATVTETTLDGAPALKAAARGGALFFDPRTLVPLQWWLTDAAGKPTIVYRLSGFTIRPLDASTASLVDLAARHPGARAVNDPALYDQLETAAEGG